MELSQKQKKEHHRTIALRSYHRNRDKHLEARREKIRGLRSADKTIAALSKKIDKHTPTITPTALDLEAKIEELRGKLAAKELEYQEIQSQGAELVATNGDSPQELESLAIRQSVLKMECDGLALGIKRTAAELEERKAGDAEFSLWWGQGMKARVKEEQRVVLTLIEEVVKEAGYLCEHSRQLNLKMNDALRARGEPTLREARVFFKHMFSQLLTWELHDFLLHPEPRDRMFWLGNYADSALGVDPNAEKEPAPKKTSKKPTEPALSPELQAEVDQEAAKKAKYAKEASEHAAEMEAGRKSNEAMNVKMLAKAEARMKEGKS